MKNNKGFSMIELLAVIAILGVIAIMGIVGYGRYLERSRKNAFENMGKTLYESTKSYFIYNSELLPTTGTPTTIIAQDLVDAGFTEYLTNPRKNKENCNQSTVKVTYNGMSSDNMNMNLNYEIKIICNGKQEIVFTYPIDIS